MKKNKNENRQGNVYDRIFKENAEAIFIPIVAHFLGYKIVKYELLPEKFSKTVEREVDFLYEVELEDGTCIILHIEFQSTNDKEMLQRMQFYHSLIAMKYKLPIRHVVIFLGKGQGKMRTQLEEKEVFTGFDLINIHEMNTQQLLQSQIPEVILLAFLSDYPKEQMESILRLIIKKIKKYSPSENDVSKYLKQLLILAGLRKLETETYKIVYDMPITLNLEHHQIFKKWVDEGILKGWEQGHEEGIEKERKRQEKKERQAITRMYQKGFSTEDIAEIMAMDVEKVLGIIKNVKR